ncbi:MAG TPA: 4-(cytidine 5'-diphospho)-2-C-methyl-D-erythritol kinase [Actinomycetota bacterium]
MSGSVVGRAPAKLNVFLRVRGRREDGFHDIETVLLPLDLHDVVTVEPAGPPEVVVRGERAQDLADAGGELLVARAIQVFAERIGPGAADVRVTIDKRIPVAAGLGGGSADAAAVLRILASTHDVPIDDLLTIAEAVGSDVPALVHGGAVFAAGRGERVIPVHAPGTVWVAKPFGFGVRSGDAYDWWDRDGATGPDPGALIAALETANLEVLGPALYDDLQPGVARRHPEIEATIQAFHEAGALGVVMSGSGPTVVALARHHVHAEGLRGAVPGSLVVSGPPGPAAYDDGRSGVV